MKQAWVNKKEKEKQEKANTIIQQIRQKLLDYGKFSNNEVEELINNAIYKITEIGTCDPGSMIIPTSNESLLNKRFCTEDNLLYNTIQYAKQLSYEELYNILRINYSRYLDSTPVEFCGDIIITDPCYIIKDEDWSTFCDNENITKYIPHSIVRDTIYGDWSCTTFDKNTKKVLGNFCADSGLVGVFNLNEVLKYNPNYNDLNEYPHTVTLIKDFKGKVYFNIKHHNNDYSVHVIGKGINIKTNKSIEFITYQTGF